MALLRGKLYAGALYAGLMFGPNQSVEPPTPPVPHVYAGGRYSELHHKIDEEQQKLALLCEEDNAILQIIIHAVTQGIIK